MSSRKEVKLLVENWRGFLNEEEASDSLESFSKELLQALSSEKETMKQASVAAMKAAKAKSSAQNKKEIDEVLDPVSLSFLAAGLIASMPKILAYSAKFARKIGKIETEQKLVKWAEANHKFYIKTFITLLNVITVGFFSKLEEKKQKEIAELLYMCVVAYLLPHAAGGALNLMKVSSLGTAFVAGVESILALIKSEELLGYMSKNINTIIGVAATAASATTGMSAADLAAGAKMTLDYTKSAAKSVADLAKGKGPGVDQQALSNLAVAKKQKKRKK